MEDDLPEAAKRLSVPLWGRLLLRALIVLIVAIAGALWYGFVRMNSSESATNLQLKGIRDSIRVLADKTPDKDLINQLMQQARAEGNAAVEKRLQPVEKQLNIIDASAKAVAREQQELKKQVDGQQAMIRIGSPSRILAIIQQEIRIAETSSSVLPAAQLADYKSAIRAIPDSQTGYWQTVAAVVNYQSLLNQLNGYAPDPTKVARPCPGFTTQVQNAERRQSVHRRRLL